MTIVIEGDLIRRAVEKLLISAELAEISGIRDLPEIKGGVVRAEDFRAVARELATALNKTAARVNPERARLLAEEAVRTRPTQPPAWLADIQPLNPPTDSTNGMHRVIGAWPGDETDDEIREALAEIS